MSPLKTFFEEEYDLNIEQVHVLKDLLEVLNHEGITISTSALNIESNSLELLEYSFENVNQEIQKVNEQNKSVAI